MGEPGPASKNISRPPSPSPKLEDSTAAFGTWGLQLLLPVSQKLSDAGRVISTRLLARADPVVNSKNT